MKSIDVDKLVEKFCAEGFNAKKTDDGKFINIGLNNVDNMSARISIESVERSLEDDLTDDEAYESAVDTYKEQAKANEGMTEKMSEVTAKIGDWDFIKDRLRMCLRMNSFEELKGQKFASKDYINNMRIYYYVMVSDEANAYVSESMLKAWDKAIDDIHAIAFNNTKNNIGVTVKPFNDILLALTKNMSDIDEDTFSNTPFDNAFIVSNPNGHFGATSLLFAYDELKEISDNSSDPGQDLVVLPSSVHELIVFPKSVVNTFTASEDEFRGLVQAVNTSTVDPLDWLSDVPYVYNIETKTLEIY